MLDFFIINHITSNIKHYILALFFGNNYPPHLKCFDQTVLHTVKMLLNPSSRLLFQTLVQFRLPSMQLCLHSIRILAVREKFKKNIQSNLSKTTTLGTTNKKWPLSSDGRYSEVAFTTIWLCWGKIEWTLYTGFRYLAVAVNTKYTVI